MVVWLRVVRVRGEKEERERERENREREMKREKRFYENEFRVLKPDYIRVREIS